LPPLKKGGKGGIRAGYSRKTARQVGAQNLSKPYIAQAIKKAQEARAERTRVDQDKVVKRAVANSQDLRKPQKFLRGC
jgi:phage terminase small subunit